MRRAVLVAVFIGALLYLALCKVPIDRQRLTDGLTGQVSENLQAFARFANQGPASDQDCADFGGQPDKMDAETLETLEVMQLPADAGGYNVLVGEAAIFVGYAWETSEVVDVLMFCGFPRS